MGKILRWWCAALVMVLIAPSDGVTAVRSKYVTMYGAVLTRDSFGRSLKFTAGFNNAYTLLAVAVGKHLTSVFHQHLKLGIEGQAIRHFGGHPHGEINGLMLLRWTQFPWNSSLWTTFAAGAGVSYATEVPELEELQDRTSAQLLGYVLVEWTFGLPRYSRWALTTRIHHRSGADGKFSPGVYGASNALGLGVSYSF